PRFSLALVSNSARLRLRGRVPEIDRAEDTLESVIRGLFLRHWISPRDAAIRCAVAVAVRQRIAIQIHAAKLRESRQRVSIGIVINAGHAGIVPRIPTRGSNVG